MRLALTELTCPIGRIRVVAGHAGVCDLDFAERWEQKKARLERRVGAFSLEEGDPLGVAARLAAYFAGAVNALDDVAIDPGGTAFQRAVWGALRAIPPGKTRSYGDLAAALGKPQAPRAVGAASGSNPIAIVVPCHRLIGANGSLTGYAGGKWRKQWLLTHEGALAGQGEMPLAPG